MSRKKPRPDYRLPNHEYPQPPEELRALCGLSDVRIEYIHGRPAKTWRLSVSGKPSITLQSVQYEDWAQAVKTLLE
jgi:hypothetical protein